MDQFKDRIIKLGAGNKSAAPRHDDEQHESAGTVHGPH
jgi:hypothetical protein